MTVKNDPKDWRPGKVKDANFDVDENDYRGYQTRLLTDSKGVLHLAFIMHEVAGTTHNLSLKYVSCN